MREDTVMHSTNVASPPTPTPAPAPAPALVLNMGQSIPEPICAKVEDDYSSLQPKDLTRVWLLNLPEVPMLLMDLSAFQRKFEEGEESWTRGHSILLAPNAISSGAINCTSHGTVSELADIPSAVVNKLVNGLPGFQLIYTCVQQQFPFPGPHFQDSPAPGRDQQLSPTSSCLVSSSASSSAEAHCQPPVRPPAAFKAGFDVRPLEFIH
ncbi:hypothetical protein Q5P01_006242 [Channa striata]|uniref:Uncharacterized protein n=1 Tax=Channa striata TaxID=64152 RepID=A0AA88N7Q8_CHASR|nr:hypothetical protein Q5P01_006242 [Channa striata]